MAVRPYAVAFDVLETLMDLEPLRDRFTDIGQPAELLWPWFLRFQRDAMALSLSGQCGEFHAVARQALRTASGHTATDADIDQVLDGFAELPAHPDAAPAMRALRDAGVRVGCLTVGSADATAQFLDRTGLSAWVERVVTTREAGTWKPAPAVYHAAAGQLAVPAERMALVAVHAWDCHGAIRAGCCAGWCSRLEGEYGDVFSPPNVTGDDLTAVAAGLLALPDVAT